MDFRTCDGSLTSRGSSDPRQNGTEDVAFGIGNNLGTPKYVGFVAQLPRLRVPLPTLNVPPRGGPPTARGESGGCSFLPIGLSPNIQLPVSLAHYPFNKVLTLLEVREFAPDVGCSRRRIGL